MFYILAFFSLTLFMIFTAARILQYYRIVSQYKDTTQATVTKVTGHERKKKKERPAVDVKLEYMIGEKEGASEIVVPVDVAEQYAVGKEFTICYKVSPNGAVHIASYSPANKKILIGYVAALIIEIVAFVLIWLSIL